MAGSTEMLAAFRELTTAKQLERSELWTCCGTAFRPRWSSKFGPNVKFELSVDELQGSIKVTRLRQVVETVEDPSWQIALEEARYEDPDFQVGDMLEEEVAVRRVRPRSPCRPPSSASSSASARASARGSARSSPPRWASCSRARSSRSSAASSSSC